MAQTENGQKVYDYYSSVNCDELEFAYDWCEFSMFEHSNIIYDWHKYCDEFADWILNYSELDADKIGLTTETENE